MWFWVGWGGGGGSGGGNLFNSRNLIVKYCWNMSSLNLTKYNLIHLFRTTEDNQSGCDIEDISCASESSSEEEESEVEGEKF